MPTTTGGYGTYNPGGIDPFPIESTLAQIVGTNNPAEAGNLLDVYRVQNQTASANYDAAIRDQHEYEKQRLAQQLQETYLKEFHNIAKLPGGARFLQEGGMPGMNFGGAPGAMTNLANAADVAQSAENFQKGMAGFASGSEGGYLMDPGAIPGLPPNARGVLTDNAKVRAAQIMADAKLRVAAMNKGDPDDPYTTVSGSTGFDAAGNPIQVSIPKTRLSQVEARSDTLAGIADRRRRGRGEGGVTPSGTVVTDPGAVAGGGGGGGGGAAPSATNLQPAAKSTAKPAATGGAPPGYIKMDSSSKLGAQLQNLAAQKADKWARDPRYKPAADAMRSTQSNGGVFDIYQLPSGKHGVLLPNGHAIQIED